MRLNSSPVFPYLVFRMPKLRGLPREPVIIDEQGRLTVPKRFREALGLPEGEKYPLWVEAFPGPDDCKGIMIRK